PPPRTEKKLPTRLCAIFITIAMQDKYTIPIPTRSALLTIDVQCDFTEDRAVAEIPGTKDRLPAMRRVLEGYRLHRLPIIHVVRLYRADGTNADICRREAIENGKAFVLPGSQGADLVEALRPDPALRLDAQTLLAGKLQRLAHNEWAMYK